MVCATRHVGIHHPAGVHAKHKIYSDQDSNRLLLNGSHQFTFVRVGEEGVVVHLGGGAGQQGGAGSWGHGGRHDVRVLRCGTNSFALENLFIRSDSQATVAGVGWSNAIGHLLLRKLRQPSPGNRLHRFHRGNGSEHPAITTPSLRLHGADVPIIAPVEAGGGGRRCCTSSNNTRGCSTSNAVCGNNGFWKRISFGMQRPDRATKLLPPGCYAQKLRFTHVGEFVEGELEGGILSGIERVDEFHLLVP